MEDMAESCSETFEHWMDFMRRLLWKVLPVACSALICLFAAYAFAQQPASRITAEITNAQRATLPGSHPPMANATNDVGRVPAGTKLTGMSIVFSRTPSQEANLQALIATQQNPASAQYHKWLTPDAYAASFGVSDADIAKVQAWLEQQGFAVTNVARSKTRITFNGTASQAEAAFGTELHYYKSNGETHYAPSADLQIPAALSSVVASVGNLSDFRPHPHHRPAVNPQGLRPNFTSSQTGDHFLTPKDVATIYDINAAYNAGYTGYGQSIAVVGQSSIELSDIENFQSAAGLTTKDPTLVLVPDSGTAAVSSGDEAESDLDLEYSGGIAKDATIYFVYVGNNNNYSVWDSISYAVDTRIAPIITTSYGACETELSSSDYTTLNGILEQAASQGQSVISAAGDSGSTDCYGTNGLTTAQQEALAVDFPASSQYVTAMGGTEFPSADVASTNTTYWESASGSDVISSALSYIPEQVWNDDSSANGLSSGGGGTSSLTARPSWQTGVTGIPSGDYRLVPDISIDASNENAPYLYCSSDTSAWTQGQAASCNSGFRDSSTQYLTAAGGTSFAAPIFAGMLAIINQKLNSTGQGLINSTLYTLAASSSTYASAFHDTTSGSNACTAGSTYCSSAGESDYSATTGYDEASGLGSVDLYNLLTAWPTSGSTSSTLQATITTLTAATTSPAPGAADAITITVAPQSTSLTTSPTGTLTIVVDGTTATSSLALSNGSATYSFSSTTTGAHVIQATYSGDSTYASSTASLTLTVGSSSTSASFTLAATNVTIASGNTGTSTITITPSGGYTGTIDWSVSADPTISNGCYSLNNATISGTTAVTETMTIYTSASSCTTASLAPARGGKHLFAKSPAAIGAVRESSSPDSPNPARFGIVMAGVLFGGLFGFRSRRLQLLASVLLLILAGLTASGCGSSSSSTSSTTTPASTYTLTITGADSATSSISASTTMTLTVD